MQGTEKENKHDESGSNDEINECKKLNLRQTIRNLQRF